MSNLSKSLLDTEIFVPSMDSRRIGSPDDFREAGTYASVGWVHQTHFSIINYDLTFMVFSDEHVVISGPCEYRIGSQLFQLMVSEYNCKMERFEGVQESNW